MFENAKMIALDLDGTTLTREGLTRRTKETLEEAISRGYTVVIATGRAFAALPEKVLEIKGLKHLIISNGAHIMNLKGEFLFSDYIGMEASLRSRKELMEAGFVIEVFSEGKAYIDGAVYSDLEKNGSDYLSTKYILRTRKPIENVYDFWLRNADKIENVNIFFRNPEDRLRMKAYFEQYDDITVTSSLPTNVEIGGKTTSKAAALALVCEMEGLSLDNVIAFGDSLNDEAMLRECGYGVAMGNAVDELKEIADYVAPTNDEEGVAYTIRKYLFGENLK